MSEKTVLRVEGMSCQHCVNAVTEALNTVPGVEKAKVDLKKGEALVKHRGDASIQAMKDAITEAGFIAN